MQTPSLTPKQNLPPDMLLARARGGLAWLLITLFLAWLCDSGIGFSDYLRMLQAANQGDTPTTPFMAIFVTFYALFGAALGQIFGEELSGMLWEREQRLLHQSSTEEDRSVWRKNLLSDPFEWMVAFHGWISQLWWVLPGGVTDWFSAGGLFERLSALTRRSLCFLAGLSGTFFLVVWMQMLGFDEWMTGSAENVWQGLLLVLLLGNLFALAFTSLAPISLVLLTGIGLAYGGIMKMLTGELPVLGFLVLLNGVFLILVAIRSLRSRFQTLEHRKE